MDKIKPNSKKISTIVAFLFVFILIFGNIPIINIHIVGIIPTYYRAIIPVFFMCILIKNVRIRETRILDKLSNIEKYTYALLIFWIVYGVISIIISPWSDYSYGLKEVLNLCLGTLSIYITVYLYEKNEFENIILAFKISLIILLLIGYFEILTGKHLSMSMFSDTAYLSRLETLSAGEEIRRNKFYIATGIFYNPNDYCAFLSIFSPVFLYFNVKKRFSELLTFLILFAVFLILLIDDAWICLISLVIGIIVYLVCAKANMSMFAISVLAFLFARYFGRSMIDAINNIIYKISGNGDFSHSVVVSNIENTLNVQIDNASQGHGSLYYRINTYMESIKEMFLQSKGAGLGAGSYQNYFADIAAERNMMANPHCLWIEILSQYGVIIFLLFVILMVLLIIKLFKQYLNNKEKKNVLIISMGMSFALASFAPSAFLMNSYYWVLIGLGIVIVSKVYDK